MPSIVDLEIRNRLKKTVQEEINTIAKLRIAKHHLIETPEPQLLEQRLLNSYEAFIKNISLEIIDCDKLSVSTLIKQAVTGHKPFSEGGRGFQDAVIWQAIIKYLEKNKRTDIIFITQNTKDFGRDGKLHEELQATLLKHKLKSRVQYFDSMTGFLAKHTAPLEFINEPYIREILDEYTHYISDEEPHLLHLELETEPPPPRTQRSIASSYYIHRYSVDAYYILEENVTTIRLAVEFTMDFIINLHDVEYDEYGEINSVDYEEGADGYLKKTCVLHINKKTRGVKVENWNPSRE